MGWCPRCGGEIYRYDIVGEVEGTLVHEECMTFEEKVLFPVEQEDWYRGG